MKNKTITPHLANFSARTLGLAVAATALLSSCESSKPAPYIYVAPQKKPADAPAKPVVAEKPKPKPSPAAAAQARRFSLEERERLEPVQAGGTGETLKTGIITTEN